MLTKYITSVSTAFSPFNARTGSICRHFLAQLPANARSTMAIDVKMFGRNAAEQPAHLTLKFKDGREFKVDLEKFKLADIENEVNRHSRLLGRKEELEG